MEDYEKLGAFYLGREVDPATGALAHEPLLYDSRDLTTHAVCVGMTGSGKTGLCLALLEEAAIDGVPALCIDPKGDLGNLLLAFPNLAPADFLSWIDAAEAQRQGQTPDQLAIATAQRWKEGLAQWDQTPERIARFRDAADVAIYTPGSESGLPLSVLRSFAAPGPETMSDTTALRERIASAASGLLALLGRDADPLKSRDHILLANVLEDAWRRGVSLDIAGLIHAVQKPPIDRVGAFDLETFYPARERLELAMALNNLLASPGFSAWLLGEPLDIQRLLFTREGKPRIAILSIAHLSDAERMFIVTLVLNELIAWMRTQSGTSSLRALFYMDEIFGFFPPTANPPSKPPMLTLLKQARAFGLGCVLSTQNPADLDYKGLANAGTWLVGRLQTERDKLRVIDGLETALAGHAAYDRAALEKLMSGLAQRTFLMRNVHDDAPVLFQSRWALSYLRGPLTGLEISKLMAQRKSEARRGADAPAVTPHVAPSAAFPRPALPADVREHFLGGAAAPLTYQPSVLGVARLHFIDSKLGVDDWQTLLLLAPLGNDSGPDWASATAMPDVRQRLSSTPLEAASYAPLPASAMRADSYTAWGRKLAASLYESRRAEVLISDELDLHSAPGESDGDFRARLALRAREKRDGAIEALRGKYATRLASLESRARAAQDRAERERSQLSQQKMQTAFSVGASLLGALFGQRRISAANVNRAATAARAAGRIGRESDDVERADRNLETVRQQHEDLQRQLESDIASLEQRLDATSLELRRTALAPRKSDIVIEEVALVWVPQPGVS